MKHAQHGKDTGTDVEVAPKLLNRKLSRSQLLAAAGAGVAAAMIPKVSLAQPSGAGPVTPGTVTGRSSYPFFPETSGPYSTERPEDIARILHTVEHLGAGVMFTGITSTTLNLASNPLLLTSVQSAMVEHQRHAEFNDTLFNPFGLIRNRWFVNSNGQPQGFGPANDPVKLTMPPSMLTSPLAFFTGVEWLETLYVGMYTAAIREMAELGQPEVAKWLAQILGVEGGLVTLSRGAQVLLGNSSAIPANNKAYETDYLLYVRDAVPALIAKGFFNGSGPALPVFSPSAATKPPFTTAAGAMLSAVVQQKINNANSTDVSMLPGPRT